MLFHSRSCKSAGEELGRRGYLRVTDRRTAVKVSGKRWCCDKGTVCPRASKVFWQSWPLIRYRLPYRGPPRPSGTAMMGFGTASLCRWARQRKTFAYSLNGRARPSGNSARRLHLHLTGRYWTLRIPTRCSASGWSEQLWLCYE